MNTPNKVCKKINTNFSFKDIQESCQPFLNVSNITSKSNAGKIVNQKKNLKNNTNNNSYDTYNNSYDTNNNSNDIDNNSSDISQEDDLLLRDQLCFVYLVI